LLEIDEVAARSGMRVTFSPTLVARSTISLSLWRLGWNSVTISSEILMPLRSNLWMWRSILGRPPQHPDAVDQPGRVLRIVVENAENGDLARTVTPCAADEALRAVGNADEEDVAAFRLWLHAGAETRPAAFHKQPVGKARRREADDQIERRKQRHAARHVVGARDHEGAERVDHFRDDGGLDDGKQLCDRDVAPGALVDVEDDVADAAHDGEGDGLLGEPRHVADAAEAVGGQESQQERRGGDGQVERDAGDADDVQTAGFQIRPHGLIGTQKILDGPCVVPDAAKATGNHP
jgi:hypothetical protein